MSKGFQHDKLEPKAEKCVLIRYPKETIGYTFYNRSEAKIYVAKNGSFLEKEFLSKEVSGRKVELDVVIVPSLELKSSMMSTTQLYSCRLVLGLQAQSFVGQ